MELTPKEKAKELVDRFNEHIEYDTNFKDETIKAKKRALICVDEMIKERQILNNDFDRERIEELLEIKQEINK